MGYLFSSKGTSLFSKRPMLFPCYRSPSPTHIFTGYYNLMDREETCREEWNLADVFFEFYKTLFL